MAFWLRKIRLWERLMLWWFDQENVRVWFIGYQGLDRQRLWDYLFLKDYFFRNDLFWHNLRKFLFFKYTWLIINFVTFFNVLDYLLRFSKVVFINNRIFFYWVRYILHINLSFISQTIWRLLLIERLTYDIKVIWRLFFHRFLYSIRLLVIINYVRIPLILGEGDLMDWRYIPTVLNRSEEDWRRLGIWRFLIWSRDIVLIFNHLMIVKKSKLFERFLLTWNRM